MSIFFSCFQILAIAMAAVAMAEPPSPYSYNRPSSGQFGGSSSGFSGSSGGFGSSFGGSSGGFGGLQQLNIGPQTNEGSNVDGQLLEQVRQILLREESQSGGNGRGGGGGFGGGGFGGGAPSGSYGPPSQSYGPPSQSYGPPSAQVRVTGIELENTIPAIQVAAFSQQQQAQQSYQAPSGSYGPPPSAPSGSYGAPQAQIPSGSYGAPY